MEPFYIPKYFKITELACPHITGKWGSPEFVFNFFDPRLLKTLDFIRETIGKKILVNNYKNGGKLKERGLRCNLCNEVLKKTNAGKMYMSSHQLGQAVDFNIEGMDSQQVRDWLKANADILPYPITVENDTPSWVHIDMRFQNNQKVYFFDV